jgi:hypothetical protein
MQQRDLKIGMCLTNDGTGAIPIYDNQDGSGTPMLTIQPKQYIGQIVDFNDGQGGYIVQFTSDDIQSSMSTVEKIEWYFLLKWIPKEVFAGAVRFTDLAANVSDAQIKEQTDAVATALDNGISFEGSIVKMTNTVKAAGKDLLWFGLGAFGLYLLFADRKQVAKKSQKLLN